MGFMIIIKPYFFFDVSVYRYFIYLSASWTYGKIVA